MTKKNEKRVKSSRPSGFQLSLDAWAVTLALGLSLLIWIGWIKHVPW